VYVVGDTVLIDDGLISLTILEITSTPRNANVATTSAPTGATHYFAIKCRVNNGQALGW
jgi:pyruvate kinase